MLDRTFPICSYKILGKVNRTFPICSPNVFQMHEFIITKEVKDADNTIYGLVGSGKNMEENMVMKKTCVRAKPNSQIREWSAPLYLLTSMPDENDMPEGTPKFHLFRKLTREQKSIEQSPEELEKKLDALKKTVREVSRMKQFDTEDELWWADFWAERVATRPRLGDGGDGGDCKPDEKSVVLTKRLLWTDLTRLPPANTVVDGDGQVAEKECDEPTASLQDLATALMPRTTPTEPDEFTRKRRVGYVTVAPGEEIAEQVNAATGRSTARAMDDKVEYFRSTNAQRGVDEEAFLTRNIQVLRR